MFIDPQRVVQLNYADWAARFPEFDSVYEESDVLLFFDMACLLCDNTARSRIRNLQTRMLLLYLLTAHIAEISRRNADGSAANPLVGRISSATEGSVSVAAEYGGTGTGQEWYATTKYGAMFWQASAIYRTARYFPGFQPRFDALVPNTGSWVP